MKYTETDGMRDYNNGVKHSSGKGDEYDMGFGKGYQIAENASAQTINPPDFNAWIAGAKLADEGGKLPDNASKDAKRGYLSQKELKELRAQ